MDDLFGRNRGVLLLLAVLNEVVICALGRFKGLRLLLAECPCRGLLGLGVGRLCVQSFCLSVQTEVTDGSGLSNAALAAWCSRWSLGCASSWLRLALVMAKCSSLVSSGS